MDQHAVNIRLEYCFGEACDSRPFNHSDHKTFGIRFSQPKIRHFKGVLNLATPPLRQRTAQQFWVNLSGGGHDATSGAGEEAERLIGRGVGVLTVHAQVFSLDLHHLLRIFSHIRIKYRSPYRFKLWRLSAMKSMRR